MKADDTTDYCTTCNGSGEGQYDGSICPTCKGSGESIDDSEQQAIKQAWVERQAEYKQYGY